MKQRGLDPLSIIVIFIIFGVIVFWAGLFINTLIDHMK